MPTIRPRISSMATLLCAAALAGCGGAAAPPARTASSRASSSTGTGPAAAGSTAATTPGGMTGTAVTPTVTMPARPRPRRHRRPAVNPGTLPQTSALPSTHTAAFRAEMAAVWRGVRSGSDRRALRAFFPEAAYEQVKAIGDPESDWLYRLVGDYQLDLVAAHALLAPDPAAARLVGVEADPGYAHWVPPNVCDNRVGYYELPNARMVYRQGGALRSFGIASLISWRGVWYVVHLGAVMRNADVGIVDDAEAGTGVSADSASC